MTHHPSTPKHQSSDKQTRAFPLGLKHLVPPARHKVRTDNKIQEAIIWCAEQTLLSNTTPLFMMFPEDLGGPSQESPMSIWDLREFQFLHGVNEACRGAGFMCQLGQAEFRRLVGIWTNIASLFGHASFDEDIQHRGPRPNHCPCVPPRQNLRGVDAADHFISASSYTLGERFWSWIFENFSSSYCRRSFGMATRLLRRLRRLLLVCHLYSQFL